MQSQENASDKFAYKDYMDEDCNEEELINSPATRYSIRLKRQRMRSVKNTTFQQKIQKNTIIKESRNDPGTALESDVNDS